MSETVPGQAHTFRRFKSGEFPWDHQDLGKKIFQADHSYKCPTYVMRTAPCQASCPSGHDIRGWLAIARGMEKPPVAGMKWQEYAFLRMVEANPFPAVMGRVCPAPCEDGCNRNEVDDHIGINAVEHFVGHYALEHGLKLPPAGRTDWQARRPRRRRPGQPSRRLFPAPQRPRLHDIRGARRTRRHGALRHSRLSHAARRARRRNPAHSRLGRRGAHRRQDRRGHLAR